MRGLFTRIAGRYDRLNRLMTFGTDRRWRREALELAGELPAGARVLDLATGTGDFAIAAARRFAGAEVTGVDATPAMLEIGRGKVAAAGLGGRVALEEGDAMGLRFGEAEFDLATCGFGFRNFPDQREGVREAARVLKPGGMLIVLELFRPERRWLWAVTAWWLRATARTFAGGRRGEYRYLRESVGRTCTRGEFAAMAEGEGFRVEGVRRFFPACDCLALRKAGDLRKNNEPEGKKEGEER